MEDLQTFADQFKKEQPSPFTIPQALLVKQPDGKFIAARAGKTKMTDLPLEIPTLIIARYNTNQTLDPTFGINGFAIMQTPDISIEPISLTIQPNGTIIVEYISNSYTFLSSKVQSELRSIKITPQGFFEDTLWRKISKEKIP